jgi:hypothetical protein
MAAVPRLVGLSLLLIGLSACGGTDSERVDLADASAMTVAEQTARFETSIAGTVAGTSVRATENGTVSFTRPRAHFYKLPPGGAFPQEVVVVGPFTYANSNVEAALHDRTVKPWTKLDARRLTPAQRRQRPDELAHVRVLAYLSDGVRRAKRIGPASVDGEPATRFRGEVDPDRVAERAPASQRAAIRAAVRNDFSDRPFEADFWVDREGRVRRVHASYRTMRGGRISVDGRFTDFGSPVDVRVPPRRSIEELDPTA